MSLPLDRAPLAPSLSSPLASNHQTRTVRLCTSIAVVVLASLGLMVPMAQAQPAQFTQNSLSSNTMTLAVPLADYPGRGGSLPVSLYYSSKVWRVGFMKSVFAGPSLRRSVTEVIYAEHSVAGWTTSLNVPKVEWPRLDDLYWHDGKPYTSGGVSSTYRVAQVFIYIPDGSTHELRKFDQVYQNTGVIDMIGTFWAVDGSRMRYDSTSQTTGTLYLADGTRYILNGTNAQYIDRNGNTVNYDGATRQWRDTLDRAFGMPLPVSPTVGDFPYTVPGLGGPITYTFKWRNLSDVLSVAQSLKCVGDHFLPDPGSPPTGYTSYNFPQPTGAASLFNSGEVPVVPMEPDDPSTSYVYVVGRGQVGSNVFNPVVLSEIVLPNGLSYKFTYNIYGEIDKVVYPTGAYQRYQYAQVGGLTGATFPYSQGNRGITSRWVSPNGTGGSDESQWQYQHTIVSGFSVITVTAPNGTRTESYLHRSSAINTFGYGDARVGKLAEERVYAPVAEGGAMLRRTLIDYAWSAAIFNRPSPSTGTYTAQRNARPVKTVGLILNTGGNALTSASTFEYDTTYEVTVGPELTRSAEHGFTTMGSNQRPNRGYHHDSFGSLGAKNRNNIFDLDRKLQESQHSRSSYIEGS